MQAHCLHQVSQNDVVRAVWCPCPYAPTCAPGIKPCPLPLFSDSCSNLACTQEKAVMLLAHSLLNAHTSRRLGAHLSTRALTLAPRVTHTHTMYDTHTPAYTQKRTYTSLHVHMSAGARTHTHTHAHTSVHTKTYTHSVCDTRMCCTRGCCMDGAGRTTEIRVRLRRASSVTSFLSYESVLCTLLHELVHNVRGPHDR